ncbi:MAG: hypothetical protein WAN30_07695, partial [Acidimicrobiales bacterium]
QRCVERVRLRSGDRDVSAGWRWRWWAASFGKSGHDPYGYGHVGDRHRNGYWHGGHAHGGSHVHPLLWFAKQRHDRC